MMPGRRNNSFKCIKTVNGEYSIDIGHLRKSGGQKIDLISLLLNKFS